MAPESYPPCRGEGGRIFTEEGPRKLEVGAKTVASEPGVEEKWHRGMSSRKDAPSFENLCLTGLKGLTAQPKSGPPRRPKMLDRQWALNPAGHRVIKGPEAGRKAVTVPACNF